MDLSMIRPELFTWSIILLFIIGALWGWTIYIYLLLKKKYEADTKRYEEETKRGRSVEELIKELREHMSSNKDKQTILAVLEELKAEAEVEKHEAIEKIRAKILKDEMDDEIDHLLTQLEHGLESFEDKEPPAPPAPEPKKVSVPEPPAPAEKKE